MNILDSLYCLFNVKGETYYKRMVKNKEKEVQISVIKGKVHSFNKNEGIINSQEGLIITYIKFYK